MRERENDKGGRRVAEDEVGPLLMQLQAGADFGPLENGDILYIMLLLLLHYKN